MSASAFSFPASIAGALVVAATPAAAQDTWSGKDKIKHVQYSCAFGLAAAAALRDRPAWQQVGLALLPGVAKEWHDKTTGDGSGWSWKDMGANLVGAAACVPVGRFVFSTDGQRAAVTYRQEF